MQSVAGRGPGAALGVLAIVVVAIGTYLSHLVVARAGAAASARPRPDEPLPPLTPEASVTAAAPTAPAATAPARR
jgi:iron(III) transport system permease protein